MSSIECSSYPLLSDTVQWIASVISLSCEIILLLCNYCIVPGQLLTTIYVSWTIDFGSIGSTLSCSCMLYILGLHTFCLLLICNSQVPIKRLLCLGTAKAVLFLSVVRVQIFLATQNLWSALGSLCMLQHNKTTQVIGSQLLHWWQLKEVSG